MRLSGSGTAMGNMGDSPAAGRKRRLHCRLFMLARPADGEQSLKLSILMPAYNEVATVGIAVKRVLDVRYPCDIEVGIVDDGSVDNTSEVLASIDDPRVVIAEHRVNRGKGAAVRTAASLATGDYLLIFDADLEYSAEDILGLLAPV